MVNNSLKIKYLHHIFTYHPTLNPQLSTFNFQLSTYSACKVTKKILHLHKSLNKNFYLLIMNYEL